MRVTVHLAQYLLAATTALDAGRPVRITSTCPECCVEVTLHDDAHLTYSLPDGRVALLVACEGYALIDPASIGLRRENWQTPEQCMADPPPQRMGTEPGS